MVRAETAEGDRQLPLGEEIFLDHVGHFVPDRAAASYALMRCGFAPTPVSVQVNPDGTPTGTGNVCAMFARGYVEVTIVGDVTEEAAVQSMSRTLGALKPRAEKKVTAFILRVLNLLLITAQNSSSPAIQVSPLTKPLTTPTHAAWMWLSPIIMI